MESFCRDLHCYCIQVNSSDYGDSRIVQPSKTEILNIIRTKGGKNRSILVEDIDIDVLKTFYFNVYFSDFCSIFRAAFLIFNIRWRQRGQNY